MHFLNQSTLLWFWSASNIKCDIIKRNEPDVGGDYWFWELFMLVNYLKQHSHRPNIIIDMDTNLPKLGSTCLSIYLSLAKINLIEVVFTLYNLTQISHKFSGELICRFASNFEVYCNFELQRIGHIPASRCSIEMGFG